MTLTDTERYALPPARCTRSQTRAAASSNPPAMNKKTPPSRKATPQAKPIAPQTPTPGSKRPRSEELSESDDTAQPTRKKPYHRAKTTPTPTGRKGRGHRQKEATGAQEATDQTPTTSRKRAREEHDAAAEEQSATKKKRSREPSPEPASEPESAGEERESYEEEEEDGDEEDNGSRDQEEDSHDRGDSGREYDSGEERKDDDGDEDEDEEEIEYEGYGYGHGDESGEDEEEEGDSEEGGDSICGEGYYSTTEDEDPGDPYTSDSDIGEDDYSFFAPRGALYCDDCLKKDCRAYFQARRRDEIEVDDSEVTRALVTSLARISGEPRLALPSPVRFDQNLSDAVKAGHVVVSGVEADYLAEKLGDWDASAIYVEITSRWNEHELGPERRDEGSRRNYTTVDRCRLDHLQASGCYRCNREFNGHGGDSTVPERRRRHWDTFRPFANDARLGNRSLEELRDMDVSQLRYAIHKRFGHPMCFEERGVCLAVDPCGDGPMAVFIGLGKGAELPDAPKGIMDWLAARRAEWIRADPDAGELI